MRRAFASEWLKLRRGGMLAALLSVVGVTALATLLSIRTAGTAGRGPRGRDFLRLAALARPAGLAQVVGRSSGLLGVVALAIFASVFASEYSHGTLRNLLAREPRRLRLLSGKLLAMASAAAVALLAALAVAVPVALMAASSKGVATSAWLTAAGLSSLAHTGVNLYLAILGWGILGAVLALVLRSPVAAIGVGVAYALPLEAILAATVHGLDRWLPGQLLDSLASGGNATASYHAGLHPRPLHGRRSDRHRCTLGPPRRQHLTMKRRGGAPLWGGRPARGGGLGRTAGHGRRRADPRTVQSPQT